MGSFFQQGEPFTDIFLRAEMAEARDGAVFHGNRSMRMSHLPVSALPRGAAKTRAIRHSISDSSPVSREYTDIKRQRPTHP